MADMPNDPLALVHSLVSAWNKGTTAATSAPPADSGHAEIIARLTLIEERLLRIETLLIATTAGTKKSRKRSA